MNQAKMPNTELEQLFYEFMNYYYSKKWNQNHHKPHHNDCKPNHKNCKPGQNHKGCNHHDCNNHHKFPIPPYTTLPYENNKRNEENVVGLRVEIYEPTQNCNENVTYPTIFKPTPEYYDEFSEMEMERVDNNKGDEAYYKALFENINKMFMPYVEETINDNDYVGSPINDKYFDKESLAQIVDQVIQKAKGNKKLEMFINDLDPKVRELIKNIAQALVLGELFVVHRPKTNLNDKNMLDFNNMMN